MPEYHLSINDDYIEDYGCFVAMLTGPGVNCYFAMHYQEDIKERVLNDLKRKAENEVLRVMRNA